METTDGTAKFEFFRHKIGEEFFYSSSPNPNDGLVGPFTTARACDDAFMAYIHEQTVLAVQQELFG